jgi:hypothetical protein
MKLDLLIILTLLFGICMPGHAKKVEIKEARAVGKNFFYQRINLHQDIPYDSLAVVQEFAEENKGLPLYYIFNFNSNGFIIVSADDAVYPIIAYSFETYYSTNNPSPEFTFWMKHYKDQILDAKEKDLQPDSEITATWAQLSRLDAPPLPGRLDILEVQPLISDTWDQDFPYNAMCPEDPNGSGGHVLVGCVATAMSMIMHYWRYPMTGQGYHCDTPEPSYGPQCASFGTTTYEWNGMVNDPAEACDPVALLSWHAGISLDMHYGPFQSNSAEYRVSGALVNYFKYDTTVQWLQKNDYMPTAWNDLLTAELDAGRPIEYGGESQTEGHAWICDGYQGADFFHMNMGWGGASNGYYYLDDIGGFNFNQNATIHIQPDPAYYPAYCMGEIKDTAYDSGSIEDGSGPVNNYVNNSSCSWLIGPEDSVQTITLSFMRFATDTADLVNIYDGATTSSPLLGTYSGSLLPPDISSTGGKMLVTFISNSATTSQGFLAEYQCELDSFCNGTTILEDPSGNFGDGSERFNYRNASTCKWKIMPAGASSVTLMFNDFKTEQNKDIVKIYDLGSNTLLAAYSGDSDTLPEPVTASSGKMLVLFQTNNSARDAGWEASYSITVGTNDYEANEEIKIYPNPGTDKLTIEMPGPGSYTSGIVSIYGMIGQELIHQQLTGWKVEINISFLPAGIYFVRLMNMEKIAPIVIGIGKFIK